MRKNSQQMNHVTKVVSGKRAGMLGLFCAAVFLFTQPAAAQQFVYNDFSAPAGVQLNGSAAVAVNGNAHVLRITPAALDQVGTAWYSTALPLGKGFSTTFRFQIGGTTSFNGDGFAFVIQNGSFCNGTSGNLANMGPGFPGGACGAQSGEGGSLGFITLTNSVAIEFDTFQNAGYGDASGDEVGIQSCQTFANTPDHTAEGCNFGQADLSTLTAPINLVDGTVHTATISYDPVGSLCGEFTCNLFVWIDGQQVMATGFVLSSLGLDANGDAFVGFTGASGAAGGGDDNQDILSWTFDTTQTQTLGGAGTTTTYTFNTDTYKFTPLDNTANGQSLTVTAFTVPKSLFPTFTSPPALNVGETCIPYGDYSTSVDTCVEFQAEYTPPPLLPPTSPYSLATGYDLPPDLPAIGGPDFLVAHGQPCPLTADSIVTSIFISYEPGTKDHTTRGTSRGPSCFVATYTPTAPVITTTGVGFKGFGAPVVNTDLNQIKAGSARPLTFQFFDNLGSPVLNLAYCNTPDPVTPGACLNPVLTATPTAPWVNLIAVPIPCTANAVVNGATDLTVTAAGNSGFQNNGGGNYQLNWKTQKGLTGCANVQVTYSTGGAANAVLFPAALGFRFN
jgi:hypothetical protein